MPITLMVGSAETELEHPEDLYTKVQDVLQRDYGSLGPEGQELVSAAITAAREVAARTGTGKAVPLKGPRKEIDEQSTV